MDIAGFILLVNAAIWSFHWWYMSYRFHGISESQEPILAELDGLRIYLYEIDPQFDDERAVQARISNGAPLYEIHNDLEVINFKRGIGKRTLATRFSSHY